MHHQFCSTTTASSVVEKNLNDDGMIDDRGGCYVHGGTSFNMSKVEHLMLRFRPIAPKPTNSGSVPGEKSPLERTCKRRYVRNGRKRKRRGCSEGSEKTNSGGSYSDGNTVMTLPLLTETPDRKDTPARKSGTPWWSFDDKNDNDDPAVGAEVVAPRAVRVVGTVVTVESVTEAWVEVDELGCTDEERMVNLARDTCPAFVTDGSDRVRCANRAYREMVGQGGEEEGVVVWVVIKEGVAEGLSAFTCRVRLQMEKRSLTLPCDVWRMDGGGLAWRLDLKAALTLGW